MEVICTKVPPEVKRATEAEAKRAGMSVSEYLRTQLRKLTDTEPRALDELDAPADTEAVAA